MMTMMKAAPPRRRRNANGCEDRRTTPVNGEPPHSTILMSSPSIIDISVDCMRRVEMYLVSSAAVSTTYATYSEFNSILQNCHPES